eukprot:symbB.v1.2.033200.t1/scaffold4093.1/size55244/4
MARRPRDAFLICLAGLAFCSWASTFTVPTLRQAASAPSGTWGRRQGTRSSRTARQALTVDLTGKVAFIAGKLGFSICVKVGFLSFISYTSYSYIPFSNSQPCVADTSGYGWAIARELANAGATIVVGTWPPVLKMFNMALKKKATDEAKTLDDGSLMEIAKIYPLDAMFDVPDDVPDDIKSNKRYAGVEGYTIEECVEAVKKDYGKVDILVHSLANGPEVTKPLLETSRKGYLAASSASAYSLVSMVQRFGPIMPKGGAVISLSYVAAVRTIPGYGGGMSSAKAQLESDTRTLAYEAGRKFGIRVNTISAGPLKSRAASAIGGDGEKTFIERAIDYSVDNAPLDKPLYADDVGRTALCLLTDLTSAVTGMTMYVDMGLHSMGQSLDSPAYEGLDLKSR